MSEDIDRLAREYAEAQHDVARLTAAAGLAVVLAETGDLDRAWDAVRGAERYAHVLGDHRSRAIALHATGVVKRYGDDHVGALECLRQALYHARNAGDPLVRARVLTAAAASHYELGQYVQAIEQLTVAFSLAHEADDEMCAAEVYRCLAAVYSRLEDPERASRYARRALVTARAHGATRAIAESLILLGNVWAREQERLFYLAVPGDDAAGQEALAWYAEARAVVDRLDDERLEYRLVNNTARTLLYLERYEEAAHLLTTYLSASTARLRPPQIAVLRFGIGEATLHTDPQAALPILLDAVRRAEEHRAINHIPKMHLAIANAYEMLGDTANALAHHKAYHQVERLVRGEEARSTAALAAIRLDAEEIKYESNRLRRDSDALNGRLESLRNHTRRLDDTVRRDALTDLANRRAFDELLERVFSDGRPISVALLDIDRFKAINDTHSHLVGDEVLRRVARVLQAGVRLSDLVARYGGEEFGMVFPGTPIEEAAAVCERLRQAVADTDWTVVRPGLRVTLSAGVAQEATAALALSVADKRLYEAKRAGRNRVVAG